MSDQGKIPADLILSASVPLGIRAYRRRFISPVTNLQEAEANDYPSIYPETSTPGSFIDPESTYLTFDFEVINSHYCVDYTDFGIEGVGGAVIQDWRVYNQGTILEEILDYPIVASVLNNLEGSFELETYLFFSSKLKNGFQGEYHRNFIKPPMVDNTGNIMFGPNPFGLGIADIPNSSQYANTMLSGTNGTSQACSQMVSASGQSRAIQQTTGLGYLAMNVDNQPPRTSFPFQNTFNVGALPSVSSCVVKTDKDYMKNVSIITPMDFPDQFVPSMVDIVRNYKLEYGTINKPQIMANLCNVKCYPIGCKPVQNAFSCGSNITAVYDPGSNALITTNADQKGADPLPSNPKYRICYRPFSGIFGKMATKMLATTLIAPQQMYINLHLAANAQVFNVSADPCRRVPGTIRDYLRNRGYCNGAAYGADLVIGDLQNVSNIPNLCSYLGGSNVAPGYCPGILTIPSPTGTLADCGYSTASLSTIFSSAAACGNISYSTALTTAGVGTIAAPSQAAQAMPPTPQYVLSTEPWFYKCIQSGDGKALVIAKETDVFYGTYLQASVPQSKRIFALNSLGVAQPGGFGGTDQIRYKLSNIALVGDQLILPNETTADIISMAESGGYNVHTNSIRTYTLQIPTNKDQSIICPFKVNMAKRILFIFQDSEVRDNTKGFVYDSNCGLNPFASISKAAGDVPCTLTVAPAAALPGVGFSKPLVYNPTKCGMSAGFSVQLRIGNDFYPQTALSNMQEVSAELVKTMEGWSHSTYSPQVDGQPIQGTADTLVFDCLEGNKYTTAFIPNEILDDQTITANVDFVPLHCQYSLNPATFLGNTTSTAAGGIFDSAANRGSVLNGHNKICPRGYCVKGVFKTPSSRFVLGFNMRSFKSSDGVDGGQYLGNSSITLLMSGAEGLAVTGRTYRGYGIIPHRVAMRYAPSGQIVWAY